MSETLECGTGAPQGAVLAPFLNMSDFNQNSEPCHFQQYSDNTSVVACVPSGQEGEYWDLVEAFTQRSNKNCLFLNSTKT